MKIADVQGLWDPKTTYLNTATYGLPPLPTWDALQNALEDWRGGRVDFVAWQTAVDEGRAVWARLVGVPEDWVCIGSTVSGLIGLVAASLLDGSRVLVPEIEFTSALWPWMVHADRGIEVVTVPVAEFINAIDDSIDLVCFSSVQSATGEVLDAGEITSVARAHGAQVFVDATQACGWLPMNASEVDYCASGGYKWLLSPRGTAFMSVSPKHLDGIRPLGANWSAGADVHASYYGPPLRLADSARRLDASPAWFSWVATKPSLELIEAVGVAQIHDHNIDLANSFRAGLGLEPGNSAIVSADWADATESLNRAGVMATLRAGRLRASFHLYNNQADVDAALKALRK